MIESIKLGDLWGVPATIELVDRDRILLERFQKDPYYCNESLEFKLDGTLLTMEKVEDVVLGDQDKYDRSKFGITLDHKNGIITRTYDRQTADTVKHKIKTAYDNDAKEFLNLLRNTSVTEKQKPLKNKMLGLLAAITNHDFTQYMLYKVK